MHNFPMSFPVSVTLGASREPRWKAVAGSHHLEVAVPPEFGGPGGAFSPEDLYALALANCFAATFSVFAKNSSLPYLKLECKGDLVVDKNPKGQAWMQKILIEVELTLENEQGAARAERLLKKVSESCMILNSVLTEKEFRFKVAW